MSLLPLRYYGDPILNTRADEITTPGAGLDRLIANMTTTMHATGGIGLAANQIGVLLRVFVFDVPRTSGGMAGYLINPQLTVLDDEMDHDEEGCLSIPGVRAKVPRHRRVRATGFDLDFRPVMLRAEGLLAHCFQHETDHLDGVLFPRRLPREYRREIMAELNK